MTAGLCDEFGEGASGGFGEGAKAFNAWLIASPEAAQAFSTFASPAGFSFLRARNKKSARRF